MGNLYSKVWPSKKQESKVYMTPLPKKGTVLTAVEDIQKLTTEQMEEQFDNVCRASHKVLHSLTHNPCGQLSLRIKQCLDENVQQMSKCFAVMDDYRACVSQMMSDKLADVVTDFEKPGEGTSSGDSYDMMKEDDLAEKLERELKRRVEELKPKGHVDKGENGEADQSHKRFRENKCEEN